MVGSGSKTLMAYLFMLLIMRKMQCSENRQNIKRASLLRKIKIPSRFQNVRTDRTQAPKCEPRLEKYAQQITFSSNTETPLFNESNE